MLAPSTRGLQATGLLHGGATRRADKGRWRSHPPCHPAGHLGAPAATRTRHPFASSRSDRPGNEDAAPFPARRYPKPVSALRVRASHTIYDQKTEGGADPVSRVSAACAPEAEPSRAEPSQKEPSRGEPSREEPSPTGRRREEPSSVEPCQGEPSSAEWSRAPGELSGRRANKRG